MNMSHDLTIQQAAENIGVHKNTIRKWIADGVLMAYRLNGTKIIRITQASINELKQPVRSVETDEC
jgi:excisionase family DNA binding protein